MLSRTDFFSQPIARGVLRRADPWCRSSEGTPDSALAVDEILHVEVTYLDRHMGERE